MALFDQFSAAQAGNGQAIPSPQATAGAPGMQLGSWGYTPPNLAAGMRNFLQPNPKMGGQFGQPPTQAGGIVPPGPGGGGMPVMGTPAPQMGGSGMSLPPQLGQSAGSLAPQPGQSVASGNLARSAIVPNSAGNTGMPMDGSGQPPSYAGGMQQFLANKAGMMR